MNILLKPIVTEKMMSQSEGLNRYGFQVDTKANKIEIRNAIEQMYGVTVTEVNTMKLAGKSKVRNTRAGVVSGRTNHIKKAIVTVKEGDKIDFYSNI